MLLVIISTVAVISALSLQVGYMLRGKQMTQEAVIRKVWLASKNNVKHVTLPKHSNIKAGDYVKITKVEL